VWAIHAAEALFEIQKANCFLKILCHSNFEFPNGVFSRLDRFDNFEPYGLLLVVRAVDN
jgi:hypothetical protein